MSLMADVITIAFLLALLLGPAVVTYFEKSINDKELEETISKLKKEIRIEPGDIIQIPADCWCCPQPVKPALIISVDTNIRSPYYGFKTLVVAKEFVGFVEVPLNMRPFSTQDDAVAPVEETSVR